MENFALFLMISGLAGAAVGVSWLIRTYTNWPKPVSLIPTFTLLFIGFIFVFLSITAEVNSGSWNDLIYMVTSFFFFIAFALAGALELTFYFIRRSKQKDTPVDLD